MVTTHGTGLPRQIAWLHVRLQRYARPFRRLFQRKLGTNRFGRMARLQSGPIHAFGQNVVAILAAYLCGMLGPGARFDL